MNLEIIPSYDIIVVLLTSIFILFISYKKLILINGFPLLITLRVLILFFLIILIINPKIEKKGNKKISLPWHVYVDNSLSIKYHKQPSSISYKKGIHNFLNKIKEKGIDIEAFSFGSSLDTIENISRLDLEANSTNLGLIFNKLNSSYQNNIAGVIIFTDGQINQGPLIQQLYNRNNKVPIHVVGIGDTIPMLDVSIKSVDIPPLCVKGENINIDVSVSSLGKINERINVTLFDEDNKLIGSKIITFSNNQVINDIRFQINPEKIGENNFLVKCSAISDEINIKNNQQKFLIQVMKDQYNIALVTGAPSYNTKVLKNHLLKSGNNDIDHFIMDNDNFNKKIKDFIEKKYEVIIFDNNPVYSNSKKWESIARVFAKKLISHSSSFFIVPGPEIDIPSLNKYLKIIDLEAVQKNNEIQKDVKWKYLDSWFGFSPLNSQIDFPNNFDSYPPQNPAFFLLNKSKEQNVITQATYILPNQENPLLLLGEKQLVRYAVWNSFNLSSLKYMLSNSDLDFLFEASIKKITNWLMKKGDRNEFIFRTNKNSYQHGESVLLTGISSDINDEVIIDDGIVELYFNGKYISSKPLFFDLKENIYKSNFWAPKPGEIEYIVKMNKGIESYKVSNGTFKVQESHVELNRIFLNKNKLINLSKKSGGYYRSWNDIDQIFDSIKEIHKSEPYVAVHIFRYNYFYICFIILLLYIEWFYRKRIGLN